MKFLTISILLMNVMVTISALFAQVPSSTPPKNISKMQQIIDKNWEQLARQLLDYNDHILVDKAPAFDGKKLGAIAAKGFEVEGQSVFAIAMVFPNFQKRDAARDKIRATPPFSVAEQYLPAQMEMVFWIYTDRTDEDAGWVLSGLSDAFNLKE